MTFFPAEAATCPCMSHQWPAAVSSIAVQTTYHLTRGAASSSSSALAAKGQIAGLLLPHRLPLRQTAPSPTCSLRPAQIQTKCFHTYAPFTPESHQITFEARPALSFCCCSIHSRLPWIRIREENLHKFTQSFVSDHHSIHIQAPASETALPPGLVHTGCADSKLVCHFRQYLASVFWLRVGSDRCYTDVSSLCSPV